MVCTALSPTSEGQRYWEREIVLVNKREARPKRHIATVWSVRQVEHDGHPVAQTEVRNEVWNKPIADTAQHQWKILDCAETARVLSISRRSWLSYSSVTAQLLIGLCVNPHCWICKANITARTAALITNTFDISLKVRVVSMDPVYILRSIFLKLGREKSIHWSPVEDKR